MRFALLLAVFLASSSAASAQQRFVDTCAASVKDDLSDADARAICACTAEKAVGGGISAASLDGLMDYVRADGDLDVEGAPAPVQALSGIVGESLFACAFEAFDEAMLASGATRTSPPQTDPTPAGPVVPEVHVEMEVGGRTLSGAAPLTVRPRSAPRSGHRVTQSGPGAVYRIRG